MEKKTKDKNNPIVKELMDYKYKNNDINKQIAIYKRTKKERIKNKKFVQVMTAAIRERGVIKCDGLVLLDLDIYRRLNADLEFIQNYVNEMEKETIKRRSIQNIQKNDG